MTGREIMESGQSKYTEEEGDDADIDIMQLMKEKQKVEVAIDEVREEWWSGLEERERERVCVFNVVISFRLFVFVLLLLVVSSLSFETYLLLMLLLPFRFLLISSQSYVAGECVPGR
jgi:hypothetical protein